MNLCSNEYFVILSRGFVVYTKRYFGAQLTCGVFKFYFLEVVIVFLIIFFFGGGGGRVTAPKRYSWNSLHPLSLFGIWKTLYISWECLLSLKILPLYSFTYNSLTVTKLEKIYGGVALWCRPFWDFSRLFWTWFFISCELFNISSWHFTQVFILDNALTFTRLEENMGCWSLLQVEKKSGVQKELEVSEKSLEKRWEAI